MKKLTAMLLALTLALGCCSALAENTKQERVYVVTAPDGTVKSLTDIVRLENQEGLEELTDRTLLTDLENVGGKEAFTRDGETVVWQAKGADITYEGTSDRAPEIVPVVTLTLDGEEITAEELKDKTGEAKLTVTLRAEENHPALAVSILPLPETGISGLKTENAAVLSEMGRQVLVGWAAAGVNEALKLPDSFSVTFQADHASLEWIMTLSTGEAFDRLCAELESRTELDMADLDGELKETEALLTALKDGTELPATEGRTKETAAKLQELNNGLAQLDQGATELSTGAASLADGAGKLKDGTKEAQSGAAALVIGAELYKKNMKTATEGAATLKDGLATLTANSDALNAGAQQIFAAVLQSANAQIAAAGLEAAGISLPELTAENYAEVLDAVTAKLDPALLKAANLPEAQTAALGVAYESLTALKAQLDQVNTFVTGLQTYTAGAAEAAAGAESLSAGMNQLETGAGTLSSGIGDLKAGIDQIHEGVTSLAEGADTLSTGASTLQTSGTAVIRESVLGAEKSLAEKLLPLVTGELKDVLHSLEETRDGARECGYDLRPEGMEALTVYIIRTDL